MTNILKSRFFKAASLENAPLVVDGRKIGWHSAFILNGGRAIGGGCGRTLDQSQRIAVSEVIERGVFHQICDEMPEEFMLKDFPSSCGFAAGFDDERTKYRAVAEAVERWALSQWIDYGYLLKPVKSSDAGISELAGFFQRQFDEVLYFHKELRINCENRFMTLRFGVCVGLRDGGAFPGARVCSVDESPWEHCLIEAWRHTLIAKESIDRDSSNRKYRERVIYFGSNSKAALNAIQSAKRQDQWPEPRLMLLKKAPNAPIGSFVWRALCSNYIGWHLGGANRFVY